MSAITFDTHAFVKRLTAAGMPEAQAEVLADEQTRLIENRLSTKADLDNLRDATRVDLQLLEQRMTIKLGGLTVIATGVILAAIKSRFLPPSASPPALVRLYHMCART